MRPSVLHSSLTQPASHPTVRFFLLTVPQFYVQPSPYTYNSILSLLNLIYPFQLHILSVANPYARTANRVHPTFPRSTDHHIHLSPMKPSHPPSHTPYNGQPLHCSKHQSSHTLIIYKTIPSSISHTFSVASPYIRTADRVLSTSP